VIETNYMRFDVKDQEKGLHLKLLNYLMEYNKNSENSYIEIVVKPAGYDDVIEIEWLQSNYDRYDTEPHFRAVGEDERVMFEYEFPDNHFEWVESMEEGKERVEEWLKENPGWIKTSYGRWINKEENDRLIKEFGLDKEGNE